MSVLENVGTLSADDLAALADLRQTLVHSILQLDVEEFIGLCTEDVLLMHPGFPIAQGKDEALAHEREQFVQLEATPLAKLELIPVRVWGQGSLAYEVGNQQIEFEAASTDYLAVSRKYIHVFTKGHDGRWLLAAGMSSNNA